LGLALGSRFDLRLWLSQTTPITGGGRERSATAQAVSLRAGGRDAVFSRATGRAPGLLPDDFRELGNFPAAENNFSDLHFFKSEKTTSEKPLLKTYFIKYVFLAKKAPKREISGGGRFFRVSGFGGGSRRSSLGGY
jgi:hypothetical protein